MGMIEFGSELERNMRNLVREIDGKNSPKALFSSGLEEFQGILRK
jgi:hypothetical protein